MKEGEGIAQEVRAAFERETRISLHRFPVKIGVSQGVVTLSGETGSVAAKKLALECAAAVPGVSGVDDRLTVVPAEVMEDAELCELVFHAFLQESAFNDFILRAVAQGIEGGFRGTPREPAGAIEAEVSAGVVTLTGRVESYAHKALAGVLAWWKRGSRDVVNLLDVEHPMEDPDGEMTDALRIVLEKDRLVNASQIRGVCRDFTVTLEGGVTAPAEREMAEADAWYLFGVNDVVNRLVVLG
jgi:osmotically-inducible protein OsmY